MKQGHHGTNHPVQNVQTKKIYITSQNHNFVVNEATLRSDMHVTHRSAFDNTIQGLTYLNRRILSFQGHPEGGPGPIDISEELFRQFIHFLTNSRIMTSVSA